MYITNIRVVWFAQTVESNNISLPYIQLVCPPHFPDCLIFHSIFFLSFFLCFLFFLNLFLFVCILFVFFLFFFVVLHVCIVSRSIVSLITHFPFLLRYLLLHCHTCGHICFLFFLSMRLHHLLLTLSEQDQVSRQFPFWQGSRH